MSDLDVALVHHLPAAGGAPRVYAEYVAQRPGHRFTVYTRMPEPDPADAHVVLPPSVPVHRFPLPEPANPASRLAALAMLERRGRELAAEIDRAGHDVVFVQASTLTQHHEVLPYLRTPAVAYSPEVLRSAYEPAPDPPGHVPTPRERLVRAGLDPYERLRKALDRRHVRRSTAAFVTHSHFTAQSLQRVYGIHADVVHLGVRADDFAVAEPAPARERRVLSVGALHPLKGHDFVVEALATLPADRRPPLTVVGDRGPLGDALREQAAALGVDLDLVQSIPFPELVRRYQTAAVLACGQRREPFGLITLEGMAAGATVVAVDEGGLAETVDHGRTGVLTPRDPAAFGAAIADVLDDPGRAARLREAGLRDVADRWTWARVADGFDARLRAAMAR